MLWRRVLHLQTLCSICCWIIVSLFDVGFMWDWYSYSYSCGGLSVGGTYIVANRDQCESVAHNSWGHNCFWCSSSDGGIHLYPHFCEWAFFFKSWSRNVAGNLGFHWMFSISIRNLHQDRVRYIVMQFCAPTANLVQAETYLIDFSQCILWVHHSVGQGFLSWDSSDGWSTCCTVFMNIVRSQAVRCCICMAGDSTFHGICFQWICTQKSVWHKCSSTGFLSVHSLLSTGFLSCIVDYQTCFCAFLLSIVLLRICRVSRMKFLCIPCILRMFAWINLAEPVPLWIWSTLQFSCNTLYSYIQRYGSISFVLYLMVSVC